MAFDDKPIMLPSTDFKQYWIAAIEVDSYNYFPKQIKTEQVAAAGAMGHLVHLTEAAAQAECDRLNSM